MAPDNGVLTEPLRHETARVVALEVPHGASPTFHGRDVFAPAAAAVAMGTPIAPARRRRMRGRPVPRLA